jgi:hypothetical protein
MPTATKEKVTTGSKKMDKAEASKKKNVEVVVETAKATNKKKEAKAKTPKIGEYLPAEGVQKSYCLKCKEERKLKDPLIGLSKNGKRSLKGTCSKCGTKTFKFISNE